MKKKTWYLVETASDRMGGNGSYRSMDEEELLSQSKSFLKCPYHSFYKLMDKDDLIALKNDLKNNKKKKEAYTIAITCSAGTAIAGKYKAKSKEEAIKAAKAEHGDQWTYYVWENPDK
jgi:hypothetical protein